MKKSRQLSGTVIIDIETGKKIGKIKDTLFIPGERMIKGFCVSSGKWLKGVKILLPHDIEYIGSDSVMVRNKDILEGTEKLPHYLDSIKEKNRVLGLKVVTDRGEELGFLEDIIINEEDCSIEGYVLTDGIIEDIIKGKLILPFTDDILFGEDSIVVKKSCLRVTLKNDISLKKVFKNTGEQDTK